MGKTLYLDCFAGISGDMMVGCLLDLGANQEKLKRALESLHLEGFETVISRVKKSGLDLCDFAVILDEAHENHDHDMEYLHGHSHAENKEHQHEHSRREYEEHQHGHHHGEGAAHSHFHRGLPEINEIIVQAEISERARDTALRIFDIIGDAEAKAHGIPKEQVHFHEVGAVDSIVDIVAVSVCLEDLDITDVIVPFLCEGWGMVRCQHGMMPVPVPAVTGIVQSHHLILRSTDVEGELVTPTGAAIVAAIRTADILPERYHVLASGMGAGKRSYSRPSILRGMIIEEEAAPEEIWKLESNIDDITGEALGYVMETLIHHGARDVYYIPAYMKKNRPAYVLSVICDAGRTDDLEKLIFENTTTIGIRKYPVSRSVLRRQVLKRKTSYGEIEVKECVLPDGKKRLHPEYEEIRRICHEKNLPYQEVYRQLLSEL